MERQRVFDGTAALNTWIEDAKNENKYVIGLDKLTGYLNTSYKMPVKNNDEETTKTIIKES